MHYERFNDGTVKCIEDEIPFNLPEGWVWTKLGCITDVIQYGLSNSAESTGDYRLLRITDIQDGYVDWESVPFTNTDAAKKYLLHKNDIVFARTGATVGKSFLITDLPYDSVYASYLIRIRLIKGISANYIYQFFNSYCYWKQVTGKAIGVGQPNCNGTALKELFIPLPSQAEQNRIVSVANNLLKIADIISFEQEDLSELIQTAKSKILDLAIRGKLVPQDPNDEPASMLLERIRAEKEELIKQGKIKRNKKESVIFKGDDNKYWEKVGKGLRCIDDEIHFEIPASWQWVRIKDIFQINPKNIADDNCISAFIPMEKICATYGSEFSYDEVQWKTIKTGYTHFADGDVVFAKITPCFQNRKSVIFIGLPNGIGAGSTELKVMRPYGETINRWYLLYFLKSPYFIDEAQFKGTANQQRIITGYLENKFFPLPPKSEQDRIVEQIKQLASIMSR